MTQLGAYIAMYSTKLGKIGSCSILSQLMLYVLVLIYTYIFSLLFIIYFNLNFQVQSPWQYDDSL